MSTITKTHKICAVQNMFRKMSENRVDALKSIMNDNQNFSKKNIVQDYVPCSMCTKHSRKKTHKPM